MARFLLAARPQARFPLLIPSDRGTRPTLEFLRDPWATRKNRPFPAMWIPWKAVTPSFGKYDLYATTIGAPRVRNATIEPCPTWWIR